MFGYDKPNLEVKLKFLKEVLIDCRSPTYRYKGFEYIFGVEKKTQNVEQKISANMPHMHLMIRRP